MSVKVEAIKPAIGARVFIDKSDVGNPEIGHELAALLEKRTVLVFPEIYLSDDEQVALTDSLGPRINFTSNVAGTDDIGKDIYQVTLDADRNPEPEYVLGTFFWHMDGLTSGILPPKGSVLSARRLAPKGGQTEFASTYAAYEALDDEEKRDLAGLRVRHTVSASVREVTGPEGIAPSKRDMGHEHPLVWTHKDGRRSLLISSTADYVIGWDRPESRALLARLLDWTAQPAFTYRHDWREGDLVVWDNTAALHRVLPYARDSGRMMHRTSIAGYEEVH
jgi:alpha-ketoglutarate-dependent taurine dioxygenase